MEHKLNTISVQHSFGLEMGGAMTRSVEARCTSDGKSGEAVRSTLLITSGPRIYDEVCLLNEPIFCIFSIVPTYSSRALISRPDFTGPRMKSAREWFRATLLVRDYLKHWKLYISLAREIVPRDSALSTTSEPNEDRTLCAPVRLHMDSHKFPGCLN